MIKPFLYKILELETHIQKAHNILLLPHANPDGDTIGSVTAMNEILKKSGKNISIFATPQIPDFLKWLPNALNIPEINNSNLDLCNDNLFKDFDLIIGLDFNGIGRLKIFGNAYKNSNAYKIIIDHHPYPEESMADLILSEPKYSSTAEFVYDILSNSCFKDLIDKTIAECLYCGIMTDTGSFAFNSSNPNTFLVVSELLSFGINKDKIYNQVYENFSFNRMRFMGHVMQNRMIVIKQLKTAYIYVTAEDRHKFREQFGDTENFVNIPLSIKGICFSAFFIERDNFVKISFRSKGTFATNEFSSKYFNGGGHINASGGESKKSLSETIADFENIINTDYKEILQKYQF
ncbi:MAG: bifunctional oligoribonuclease/PAP phosphatase NrnA [Bacteroidales bacterium]|jgi:phosphoesterase RecJ-like protein|nr:bifunctional oligoribonuclease/PAP phosphatase NrnA [Bacteroidales bacterium]